MRFFIALKIKVILLGLRFSQAMYEGSISNSLQTLLALKLRGLNRLMVKVLAYQL